MAFNTNHFDVTVTPELAAAADAAVDALLQALDFTVEVPAEERRHLLKMGEKSEEFVWKAREVALENPEIMPRGLDLGEFERAAAVRDLLRSLEERLQPLMVRLRDSRTLAGADLMNSAMQVYASLRAHGSGEALEQAKAVLRERFGRETGKQRGVSTGLQDEQDGNGGKVEGRK